jgi:hypothetical protein
MPAAKMTQAIHLADSFAFLSPRLGNWSACRAVKMSRVCLRLPSQATARYLDSDRQGSLVTVQAPVVARRAVCACIIVQNPQPSKVKTARLFLRSSRTCLYMPASALTKSKVISHAQPRLPEAFSQALLQSKLGHLCLLAAHYC